VGFCYEFYFSFFFNGYKDQASNFRRHEILFKVNERETILSKLQEQFPEIFVDGELSLNEVYAVLNELNPMHEQPVERIVLFEKKNYIAGKRGRLLRLLNRLNPNY
jgi:hypothetical protein